MDGMQLHRWMQTILDASDNGIMLWLIAFFIRQFLRLQNVASPVMNQSQVSVKFSFFTETYIIFNILTI